MIREISLVLVFEWSRRYEKFKKGSSNEALCYRWRGLDEIVQKSALKQLNLIEVFLGLKPNCLELENKQTSKQNQNKTKQNKKNKKNPNTPNKALQINCKLMIIRNEIVTGLWKSCTTLGEVSLAVQGEGIKRCKCSQWLSWEFSTYFPTLDLLSATRAYIFPIIPNLSHLWAFYATSNWNSLGYSVLVKFVISLPT